MLKIANNGDDFYKMRTNYPYLRKRISESRDAKILLNYKFIEKMLLSLLWIAYIEHTPSPYNGGNYTGCGDIKDDQVRYWENPILFSKLKDMAVRNRMKAEKAGFANKDTLENISNSIRRSGLKISVIDFSNAHTVSESYMGLEGVINVQSKLNTVLDPKKLFFFSWFYHKDFKIEYIGIYLENVSIEVFENDDLVSEHSVINVELLKNLTSEKKDKR